MLTSDFLSVGLSAVDNSIIILVERPSGDAAISYLKHLADNIIIVDNNWHSSED